MHATTSARAQRTDSASVPIVVECRIGDVASTVLDAWVHDGTLLLPVRPVLALAGLDSTAAAGVRSLADMEVLLHATVTFDTTALLVQVADSGTLPVGQRASRSRARARLAEMAVPPPPARPAPSRTLPSAAGLTYSAQRDGAVAIGVSLRVLGGVAELTTSRGARSRVRTTPSWTSLPLPTVGGARLRVGAIEELAGRPGMLLTNAPLSRADTLRLDPIGLRLRPGAELELFDDGVLVAADSVRSDGVVQAKLAERRGVHEMRMIVYDSAGRGREVRWTDYSPESLLRRGEVRYAIAAGACIRRSCVRPAAELAFAPAERLTLAARVARTDDETRVQRWTSSASLDAKLTRSAALSVSDVSRGARAGELRVERGRGESLVLRVERGDAAHRASPLLTGSLLPSSMAAARQVVSASGSWRAGSAGSFDAVVANAGASSIVGTSASAASTVGLLRGGVALVAGAARCAGISGSTLLWGGWLPRALGVLRSAALSVRGEHRTLGCGDESSGALALLLPALRWSALELGMSWVRPRGARPRVALSLALRRRIAGVVDAHAELVGGGAVPLVRSGVTGALVVDALRRSVSVDGAPAGATAAVHGIVFADDNENGRRDPGERSVAGALVRVGESSAVSDERGVFVVAGLATDRVVRLAVDPVSVEDEGYVPDVATAVLLVSRAIVRVDLPLHPARGAPAP